MHALKIVLSNMWSIVVAVGDAQFEEKWAVLFWGSKFTFSVAIFTPRIFKYSVDTN